MIGKINVSGGLEPQGHLITTTAYNAISAGDFVTFDGGVAGSSITLGTNLGQSTIPNVASVYLGNNRVMVIISGEALRAVICTIDSTNIRVDTIYTLVNSSCSVSHHSAVLININQVFVAYENSGYLYAALLTANNDNTITLTTNIQLTTQQVMTTVDVDKSLDVVAYDSGHIGEEWYEPGVLIAYANADRNLTGIACAINTDNSIAAGSEVVLSNVISSGYAISSVVQANGWYIAHSYGGDGHIYMGFTDVDPRFQHIGSLTDIAVDTAYRSGLFVTMCTTDEYNYAAFLAHNYGGHSSYSFNDVYMQMHSIGGGLKGFSTRTNNYSYGHTLEQIVSCRARKGKVYLAYIMSNTTNNTVNLYLQVRGYESLMPVQWSSIGGLPTWTYGSGPQNIAICSLGNGRVFVTYFITTAGTCHAFVAQEKVRKISVGTYDHPIDGIAKTSAAGGEMVDVYIPNV